LLLWHFHSRNRAGNLLSSVFAPSSSGVASDRAVNASEDSGPTAVSAHNLLLRKGPDFRVYIPWLRGKLVRTRHGENPHFDDPESFLLDVDTGVIHANVGDIANFLNKNSSKSPLKNIQLSGNGDQIKLRATLHKIVPLPIELTGTLRAAPQNRIQIHVTKLD